MKLEHMSAAGVAAQLRVWQQETSLRISHALMSLDTWEVVCKAEKVVTGRTPDHGGLCGFVFGVRVKRDDDIVLGRVVFVPRRSGG